MTGRGKKMKKKGSIYVAPFYINKEDLGIILKAIIVSFILVGGLLTITKYNNVSEAKFAILERRVDDLEAAVYEEFQ